MVHVVQTNKRVETTLVYGLLTLKMLSSELAHSFLHSFCWYLAMKTIVRNEIIWIQHMHNGGIVVNLLEIFVQVCIILLWPIPVFVLANKSKLVHLFKSVLLWWNWCNNYSRGRTKENSIFSTLNWCSPFYLCLHSSFLHDILSYELI